MAENDVAFSGLMRLKQVLTVVPVSRSTWFSGVRSGRFPKPVRLSPRCVAWRGRDIAQLIEGSEGHSCHE